MSSIHFVRRLASRPTATLIGAALLMGVAMPASAWNTSPPISFEKRVKSIQDVQKQVALAQDLAYRRSQDAAQEASGQPGPIRFATPVSVNYDLLNSGTWQNLGDGSRLWRLRIESPGALSLNLAFEDLELPKGAGLWIYSPDGKQIQGPYEGHHVNELGEIWSTIILGQEIIVELYEPAEFAELTRLKISRVNHGYRMFGELEKRGACNVDVTCPEAAPYADQVRSVAVYTLNGFFACTGALINNTNQDGRPLFLTANHCSTTFPNMVVYWNYQMPTCGATSGATLDDSQSGASLLFSEFSTDVALLELDDMPPPEYNVYYSGWDATGNTPASTVAIHHPSTDEKSISFDNDPANSIDLFEVGSETVWQVVDWDVGTTEPGSSGSPLFDQSSGLIVGTLFGGLAACGNDLEDWYGKVSAQMQIGTSPFLDPGNTQATTLQGIDATDIEGGGGGGGGGGVELCDQVEPSVCVEDANTFCLDDRFQIEVKYKDFRGVEGDATVARVGFSDIESSVAGLFYFFEPINWEMLVKVLDGCDINNHYWVFSAATTHVEYMLKVTDTRNGQVRCYDNPLGNAAPAITDTHAFATCP